MRASARPNHTLSAYTREQRPDTIRLHIVCEVSIPRVRHWSGCRVKRESESSGDALQQGRCGASLGHVPTCSQSSPSINECCSDAVHDSVQLHKGTHLADSVRKHATTGQNGGIPHVRCWRRSGCRLQHPPDCRQHAWWLPSAGDRGPDPACRPDLRQLVQHTSNAPAATRDE